MFIIGGKVDSFHDRDGELGGLEVGAQLCSVYWQRI
jgi:hypothetical protein